MTDQAFDVKEKLARLETALLEDTPEMPGLLRTIHKQLKEDPEIVTILTEEECGLIVSGLKAVTKTNIATKAIGTKKKAMSKMTVADL